MGRLRVALNHGNGVLVGRDTTGEAVGISVDLAREVASHLSLDMTFIHYDRAVEVSSTAQANEWDLGFLAVDPARAATIAFTDPYVQIEGNYLAGPQCTAPDSAHLVASRLAVGTVIGTAYTLALQRLDGAEHLVIFRASWRLPELVPS